MLNKFKNQDAKIHDCLPNDLTAFRFIVSKNYVLSEINSIKVFLEYLNKGEVNIYYMLDDNGDHYYLDKKDLALTEIHYVEGTKYVDNWQVYYKSKKHIGILNYYMQNAPELQSRIESIEKPDHNNLTKLAEDYHNTSCEVDKCVIYEKQIPCQIENRGIRNTSTKVLIQLFRISIAEISPKFVYRNFTLLCICKRILIHNQRPLRLK